MRIYEIMLKRALNETNFYTYLRLLVTTEKGCVWSIGCGRQHLLAELGIVLQAFKGFLGCALVGFLLAVSCGIAGIDSAQDDCSAENRVFIGIGVRIYQFKLNRDSVLLGPLDEAGLVILLGLNQVVKVKVLLYQAIDDKLAASLIALVKIYCSHERLQCVAAEVAVMGRIMG